jgi:hypothetical protein
MAGRLAKAGENVQLTASRPWWPAVGAPLEQGARGDAALTPTCRRRRLW